MIVDEEKYTVHVTSWWWGDDIVILTKSGEGMIELQYENSSPNTAYLQGLSVLCDSRRKGIGRILVSQCEEFARQDGKLFSTLSVDFSYEWLVDWYKRMGYTILRVNEHTYDMIKSL